MSKTKTTLDKLEKKYPAVKIYLDGLKNSESDTDNLYEIPGALNALMLAGLISQVEFRVLYIYYTF